MLYYIAILTYLPTLLFNAFMVLITPRRWYDRINDKILLGALPFHNLTRKLVNKEKVRAVLSMNDDFELLLANGRKVWKDWGIEFLQLPVCDTNYSPDIETLKKGVEYIKNFISKTEKQPHATIYVHCRSGRTRSVTVLACYFIETYQWSPEQAVQHIMNKRPQIWLLGRHWRVLRDYYRYYQSLSSSRICNDIN